jgi:hypothetical protein
MASIYKHIDQNGNTSFRVRVRLKGYPIQTASFNRLTDAKKWASSTESAIREGRHFKTSEAKRHTFADAIDKYKSNFYQSDFQQKSCEIDALFWHGGVTILVIVYSVI